MIKQTKIFNVFTSNNSQNETRKYGFTGLPTDLALGRMLILQELLEFPFERSNYWTCSNFQWGVIPSLYSKTKVNYFLRTLGSTLECPYLIDFLSRSTIAEI